LRNAAIFQRASFCNAEARSVDLECVPVGSVHDVRRIVRVVSDAAVDELIGSPVERHDDGIEEAGIAVDASSAERSRPGFASWIVVRSRATERLRRVNSSRSSASAASALGRSAQHLEREVRRCKDLRPSGRHSGSTSFA